MQKEDLENCLRVARVFCMVARWLLLLLIITTAIIINTIFLIVMYAKLQQ